MQTTISWPRTALSKVDCVIQKTFQTAFTVFKLIRRYRVQRTTLNKKDLPVLRGVFKYDQVILYSVFTKYMIIHFTLL